MLSKKDDYSKGIFINLIIILAIIIAYLLQLGSSLIEPFVIALLISFGIISVSSFFKKLGLNSFFSYFFSFFSFFIFISGIVWIINSNISEMTTEKNINFYQQRFENIFYPIIDYISKIQENKNLGINISTDILKEKLLNSINFKELFGSITNIIFFIISNAGLIIMYILFILLEHRYFKEKIDLMISNPLKKAKVNSIINKIKNDIRGYFLIKTGTSILTGLLSYIILVIFGVDFSLFWFFLIFILNFIPTIGSIIAIGIISIFLVLQFGFNINFFIIVSILTSIQILIGNIIEPKLMGTRLNLSPLVILLSLGFWGVIWGVVGMLLSVPIMVIINIVFSKFESTRPISIFLSEKGYIEEDEFSMEQTKRKLLKLIKSKLSKKGK